jgi:hypothetical protein
LNLFEEVLFQIGYYFITPYLGGTTLAKLLNQYKIAVFFIGMEIIQEEQFQK